jgi:hypothetical protein
LWVELFGEIGLGDWFRYLTGVLQVESRRTSAPTTHHIRWRSSRCMYYGRRVVAHLFVLNTGIGGAIIPFGLLAFVTMIALRRPD